MFRINLEVALSDNTPKMFIDLRRKEDYRKETIPGAVNIYHKDLKRYMYRMPKNKRIYLFCYTGETSDEFAEEMSKNGYDAFSIEEGYHSYLRYKLKQMIP